MAVAVIFGGEGASDGTVVYDPYDNSWTRMFPKPEPKGRSAGNMVYHKKMKKHILFGSQFSDDPHTWAYDLVQNTWTDLNPAVQPPTDRNDAVLAYDEIHDVIVASVRAIDRTDGKEVLEGHYETWTYDGVKNRWEAAKPNVEPPGGGNRRRIMAAIPDRNVVLMENYVNPSQKIPGVDREQQMWTYRYDYPPENHVPAPTSVQLFPTPTGGLLRWQGVNPSQWIVRRELGAKSWLAKEDKTTVLRGDKNGRLEETFDAGKIYYYSIVAVDAHNRRSFASARVRTQPGLIEDVVASVLSPTKIRLSWPQAAEEDVESYYVERAPVEVFSEDQIVRLRKDTAPLNPPSVGAIKSIGKFEKLTKEPILQAAYTDNDIDLTKPVTVKNEIYTHRFAASQLNAEGKPYRYAVYAYRVRAVNKRGVESGAGPYVLTIPSAPQHVFAKEQETKCHLKWRGNPEQRLTGYRIYRMESPRINGAGQPVTRVTKAPIDEVRYVHTNVNNDTRRYWIVAVDALGQEGYPSAPAWFERQYKKYYVPFTGEWHQ